MTPLGPYLLLGAILFAIGLFGVLLRRNVLVVLMGIELMLNGANLTLLTFARLHHDIRPHALAVLVMATAAAEAAVGLAIVVSLFRTRQTTNLDEMNVLKH